MLPIRRDVRFALPAERIKDWHAQGPFVTHFFNALSLLFPKPPQPPKFESAGGDN